MVELAQYLHLEEAQTLIRAWDWGGGVEGLQSKRMCIQAHPEAKVLKSDLRNRLERNKLPSVAKP